MMLQNHIIAGYLISQATTSVPPLGLALSLASHYALDYICTYPSKEMQISMQDDINTERDKITFFFTLSFLVLISALTLALLVNKNTLNPYVIACILFANLPDLYGQFIVPVMKKKRQATLDDHEKSLIKNPYIATTVHQLFTLIGFIVILFLT